MSSILPSEPGGPSRESLILVLALALTAGQTADLEPFRAEPDVHHTAGVGVCRCGKLSDNRSHVHSALQLSALGCLTERSVSDVPVSDVPRREVFRSHHVPIQTRVQLRGVAHQLKSAKIHAFYRPRGPSRRHVSWTFPRGIFAGVRPLSKWSRCDGWAHNSLWE